MPSYAFMKVLESTPGRYDRGMQILSRGKIGRVYETIAEAAAGPGRTILDIGCGTGNVSIACAARGSAVVGIDINSGMLEVSRKKVEETGLGDRIEFLEIGVAEITTGLKDRKFDACVSCLAFSELTDEEQSYAISTAYSILKPDGVMIIADDAEPMSRLNRLWHRITQAPVRALSYLLTQTLTRPLRDISTDLAKTGFTGIEETRMWNDSFVIIKAYRSSRP